MKRLAAAVLCALALVAATATGSSRAVTWPCGIRTSAPLWVDYTDAAVPFWRQIFAKPGLVIATPPGTGGLPTGLRAAGASTVYFDLKLASRVGTPDVPADAAKIVGNADALFDAAVKQTGCATPLIAENELFGSSTQTPWSSSNSQYRANVLALPDPARGPRGAPVPPDLLAALRRRRRRRLVAGRGEGVRRRPGVLPGAAPGVCRRGRSSGAATLRSQMRQAMGAFTSIGVPASRLGLMLEFASGVYGRNGLKPASAWFDYVKLECARGASSRAGNGPPDDLVVGLGDVHREVGVRR